MDWHTGIEVFAAMGAGGYTARLWLDRNTLREVVQDRRDVIAVYRNDYRMLTEAHTDLAYTLGNLRANAFITNAKGHRVRYVNATPAERARAEGQ
jgi:hypothetical protein